MNIGTRIMNKIWVVIILLTLSVSVHAQDADTRKKIESAKIALISERLGLSPEDAQRFWPIYNEYSAKRHENRMEFNKARRNFDPQKATEQETQDMLKLGRRVKEKQLTLDKEYSERMLKVINAKQLMSLHNAERDFKKMLLNRLEQRRRQQGASEQMRRQNNERMRHKRNN